MPQNELGILRAVHDNGNTLAGGDLYRVLKRNSVASASGLAEMIRSMIERKLVDVEFAGGKATKLTLLPAGMQLISETLHTCQEPFCRPPDSD